MEIGDNTTIREFVTIHRGTRDRWTTKVGSNCMILAYSHIAHDCIIGDNCILSNNSQVAGHVVMGDWVILGGMCAIHQFVKVGAHVFIAGGSLVGKDIPPYIKAGRLPLSYSGVRFRGTQSGGASLSTRSIIYCIFTASFTIKA